MSCNPDHESLTNEERRIWRAYLQVPEVRDHYISQLGLQEDRRMYSNGRSGSDVLIAIAQGISRQRVNQIEQTALRKLRMALSEDRLKTLKLMKK